MESLQQQNERLRVECGTLRALVEKLAQCVQSSAVTRSGVARAISADNVLTEYRAWKEKHP